MLRFLRKYSSSIGIKVLYGVLALLFIGWGVGAIGGERRQDVAVVYGQAISRSDLEQAKKTLTLQYERLLGAFEDAIRQGLLKQRLEALVTDGVGVSDGELEERYRFDHEKANLAFVRNAAAELAATITLSDEELQKYLDEHAETYRVPARVRARYVAYRPADF